MNDSSHYELSGITPHRELNIGDLPSGANTFVLLKNALDRLKQGEILEVRSTKPQIKEDLQSWCRLHRHTFLLAMDAGDHYRFLIKKDRT